MVRFSSKELDISPTTEKAGHPGHERRAPGDNGLALDDTKCQPSTGAFRLSRFKPVLRCVRTFPQLWSSAMARTQFSMK
jgi:hypothetical protein